MSSAQRLDEGPMRVRNQARLAPLSGRLNLQRFDDPFDVNFLVDKDTFQHAYEEKWDGAPWLAPPHYSPTKNADVIVLDVAPASSVSSSAMSSLHPSRMPTFESDR
jgi:hypothetical protein